MQLFKLRAIPIQIQHKTAIQLPIHPQPYLDWPVSSSFCSCFESLSDLQIEGQHEIWFLALRRYLF